MTSSVERYYDGVAKQYKKGIVTEPSWELRGDYWRLYRDVTWDSIQRILPKNKESQILDAGGGNGFWAIPLAKEGYNITLTDISKEIIDVAKINARKAGLNNIKFKRVDVRDMRSFHDNKFDLVLAETDVVSYCLDAEKAVSELARVAKVGAPVLISVDGLFGQVSNYMRKGFLDDAIEFLESGYGWFPADKKKFRTRAFTTDELRELFLKNGLSVKRVIGKTVLFKPLNLTEENIHLKKKENYNRLLERELKYCDDGKLIENSIHLEIIGKKSVIANSNRASLN